MHRFGQPKATPAVPVFPALPNILALELAGQVALLLLDALGAVGDFLEHDLHHVHLADGQASHL